MLALRDHRDPTQIGVGADSIVYRAWRTSDDQPVVLKVSRLAHPPAAVVARFEKEHALLASLDLPGVVSTGGLFEHDGQLVLLVEDFGGVDLARVLRAGRIDPLTALRIAVQGADALARLHAAGIVHKDVNPANVLYNSRTGVVKLADLGLATRLPREAAALSQERALRGTVRYIAPEQTGRMNRAVDARSDLYSYGASLFELLCGRPPFLESDRSALVHAHIATPPPDPLTVEADLAPKLAEILNRLLRKDPDDRYQAAATLTRDLQRCLDAVEAGTPIPDFVLAEDDVDDRFRLSQTVVGRAGVLATLRDAAGWLERPAPQALWVTGAPGIGKSALIGELEREVAGMRGGFARGKFDERRRGVPYQGLLDALSAAIEGLLRAGDDELDRFRATWFEDVGRNGQLVVDVLPSLEGVVGPQPALEARSGSEARERFVHTFLRAIQTFSSAAHPLVLFIDDLQWADAASLELVGDLLTEPRTRHLLFIGAWRDGEVDSTHGVHRLQARIDAAAVHHKALHLEPLDAVAVQALVAATLRRPPDAVTPLAQVLAQRTGGNPFFVGQLLEKLHRVGALSFDHAARQWVWDDAKVRAEGVVEDVGRLLAARLDALPAETAAVLERAALLGHEVSLAALADLTGRRPRRRGRGPRAGHPRGARARGRGAHLHRRSGGRAGPRGGDGRPLALSARSGARGRLRPPRRGRAAGPAPDRGAGHARRLGGSAR